MDQVVTSEAPALAFEAQPFATRTDPVLAEVAREMLAGIGRQLRRELLTELILDADLPILGERAQRNPDRCLDVWRVVVHSFRHVHGLGLYVVIDPLNEGASAASASQPQTR